jgi:hypothetical protein
MVRGFRYLVVVAGLVALVAAHAWAADVTGKWTWTQRGQNGEVMVTMELKQDGEKLTGTITRNDMKSEISEGKIKENEISFFQEREFNGNKIKLNYKGKLEGDTIKGNISVNFNGEDRMFDWTAMKAKS